MITATAYNQPFILPTLPILGEPHPQMPETDMASIEDVVSIHKPQDMTPEDISEAMQSIEETVSQSPVEALSVHGNLDLERVMALLS